VRDVPDARGSEGAKDENHDDEDEKNSDEGVARLC